VVDVNRLRKQKAREEKGKPAEIHRIRHGRTRAKKDKELADREHAARRLESKRLEPSNEEPASETTSPIRDTIAPRPVASSSGHGSAHPDRAIIGCGGLGKPLPSSSDEPAATVWTRRAPTRRAALYRATSVASVCGGGFAHPQARRAAHGQAARLSS
jgi:hypothetical protein